MSLQQFLDIPEKEVYRKGWEENFANLAQVAHDTTWGLTPKDRWTAGLLKMLAEQITATGDVQELRKENQVLKMQLGKAKKQIERLQNEAV